MLESTFLIFVSLERFLPEKNSLLSHPPPLPLYVSKNHSKVNRYVLLLLKVPSGQIRLVWERYLCNGLVLFLKRYILRFFYFDFKKKSKFLDAYYNHLSNHPLEDSLYVNGPFFLLVPFYMMEKKSAKVLAQTVFRTVWETPIPPPGTNCMFPALFGDRFVEKRTAWAHTNCLPKN